MKKFNKQLGENTWKMLSGFFALYFLCVISRMMQKYVTWEVCFFFSQWLDICKKQKWPKIRVKIWWKAFYNSENC